MDFASIDGLLAAGFRGFETVASLRESSGVGVPEQRGVYLVLRTEVGPPTFLDVSAAGRLKGKDPTVPLDSLAENWVDGALVLYIGQAGGGESVQTLRQRIRSLLMFGAGSAVGHWGGRLLWQVAGSDDFAVCWRPEGCTDPEEQEGRLIREFKEDHGGMRPFANLSD